MSNHMYSLAFPCTYLLDKGPCYVVRIAVGIAFVPAIINLDWSVCEVTKNEVEAFLSVALKLKFNYDTSPCIAMYLIPKVFPFLRRRHLPQSCNSDLHVWRGTRHKPDEHILVLIDINNSSLMLFCFIRRIL